MQNLPTDQRFVLANVIAVLFSSIREECERMGVNERVLISDEAGRQFYVPPLRSADS